MLDLIFVDVDGTLLGSSGAVLPEVWDAAARMRARGVRLAICSGRPGFGTTRDYARRLDPDGWHVFQNGASVVQLASSESHSATLPPLAVDALVARARATGRILELYSDGEYVVESTAERAQRHAGLLGLAFEVRDFASLAGRAVRAQWLVPHDEAEELLAESSEGLLVSASLSPVMPDTTFVNLTAPGVDKSSAVRAVAGAYGVPLDRVMMVGDGANDATAMRAVGFPVAMGNAEREAREVARYVVSHVDDGGLIEAFDLALSL